MGASLKDVVKMNTYLVRARFLPAPPPSTLVVVSRLVHPDCLIEVNVVAVLPEGT